MVRSITGPMPGVAEPQFKLFSKPGESMHAMLNMALRAARAAADLLALHVDRCDRLTVLAGDGGEFVTSADLEAERTILHHLQKAYPRDGFQSRPGESITGSSDTTWIIDPVVGGRNFYSGHPMFGVAIACQIRAVVEHGVIVLPMLGEEFCASRGSGARLNSKRIRVGSHRKLASSLVGLQGRQESGPDFYQVLLAQGAEPRSTGVPAIDLVYAAADKLQAGSASAVTSPGLAAALLIFQEAGGLVCSESGHPDLKQAKELLYANPRLCKSLLHLRQSVTSQDKTPRDDRFPEKNPV